jgi:hypothetical protein
LVDVLSVEDDLAAANAAAGSVGRARPPIACAHSLIALCAGMVRRRS